MLHGERGAGRRVSTNGLRRVETAVKSDEELMAAHIRGERGAFDELFRRHAARLGAVLARGLHRSEDARDLLQQVFLQVHRHRADYQSERPFRPWLFTIALNLKRQYLRTKGRRPESALDDLTLAGLAHEAADHQRVELRQLLDRALSQLPEEAQEVVLLHWFGGLAMSEIADMVGASEAAVKVRAHRAYKVMRSSFETEQASLE
jgi:RNA polymerase sigma-70 factor (ECF subfamily)